MTCSALCSNKRRLAPLSSATKSPLAGPKTPNRMHRQTSTRDGVASVFPGDIVDGSGSMLSSPLMASRLAPPAHPVSLEFDGETLVAEKGEPLAFALLAADKLALSRSPKLHRPHGPYCLRGGCDGCLARVNGEPNVMTCMVPCVGGERVETQNVLG